MKLLGEPLTEPLAATILGSTALHIGSMRNQCCYNKVSDTVAKTLLVRYQGTSDFRLTI